MRHLIHLLSTDLTVSLAVLLVLGGSFLLPFTEASSSSMTLISAEVTCTGPGQICADEDEEPSSGSGGGGLPYIPPVEPPVTPPVPVIPPIEPPVPVIPPIDPPENFVLYDVAPKILYADKPTRLILYATNFPSQFQIHVKGPSHQYSLQVSNTGTNAVTGYMVRFIQEVPANVLPLGPSVIWVTSDGASISPQMPVYIHAKRYPLGLDATAVNLGLIEVTEGTRFKVSATFTNTGITLDSYMKPLVVGTMRPYDRFSKFYDASWVYGNRPAIINFPEPIPKGEVFSTDLWLTAPQVGRTTTYTEYFGLVAEGIAWMPHSQFSVRVKVVPAPSITPALQPVPDNSFVKSILAFLSPTPSTVQASAPKSPYLTPKPTQSIPWVSQVWNTIKGWFR